MEVFPSEADSILEIVAFLLTEAFFTLPSLTYWPGNIRCSLESSLLLLFLDVEELRLTYASFQQLKSLRGVH